MTNNRKNFRVFDLVLGNGTRIENINTSGDVDNLLKLAQAESLKDLLENFGVSADLPLAPQGELIKNGHSRSEQPERSFTATQSLPLGELLPESVNSLVVFLN